MPGSAYLSGAVLGALFFGWLTDRLGRKKLFFITIAVYLSATALTGLAWNGFTFFLFRFLTGAGIGGEYAAINSTIQELIPARFRGHLDLMINGSFWVGAALGALVAVALLNPSLVDPELGWRLAFLTGALIGLVVFAMRMWIPESPRWLAIHGREAEGEAVVAAIEKRFIDAGVHLAPVPESAAIRLRSRTHTPLREVFDTLFNRYRLRTFVGLTLMAAQAFFYNAIFFTYALVLTKFYGVGRRRRLVYPALRRRQFPWAGRAGPAVRHTRTAADDLPHLRCLGPLAGYRRSPVRARSSHRRHADHRLDDRVLCRIAGGKRRLPHGQRNLPDRDPSADDRGLLRHRHRPRRRRGALCLRQAHRKRIAPERLRRLCVRRLLMFAASFVAARYAVRAERKPLEEVATPLSAAD